MSYTYKIQKATISYKKGKKFNLQYSILIFKKIMRKIYVILIFLFCVLFTYIIYKFYINDISLENTITIGALLSTLGSSIISVASYACNENLRCFEDNFKNMQKNQEFFDAKWERRPFYKRISKYKYTKNEYEYCFLENPMIVFSAHMWNKRISIPSSREDFYELPIIRNYLTLRKNRKYYRIAISLYQNKEALEDILVWDNLTDMYKNILRYKLFHIFSTFGWSLLINSIIFSFLYYYYPSILETFKTLSSQYLQCGPN